MERYYSRDRPPTRRRPLEEAPSRGNESRLASPLSSESNSRYEKPSQAITHAQKISTARPSTRPTRPSLGPHSSDASCMSTVGSNHPRDVKRDSAVSNASTDASNGLSRKSHIGPWQLGKTIGRGGCSRVRAVRHSVTGQIGAAKIISKSTAETVRAISLANLIKSTRNEASRGSDSRPIPVGLEREIVIMKLLDHQNIVKLYDVWENRNEIYIIMEYVPGGELFNYISERRGLDEDEAVYLFRQIIAALLYCHRINIHHRDLKPENILLDQNTHTLKLVDFGMAALQPEGSYLSTPCGSPHYAAPEVIRSRAYDGGRADIWSCGVILYVMLAGCPPFNYTGDEDLQELFRSITSASYIMPDGFSREAKDLIRRILVPDPRKRITIENVWHHPLLHKYDAQFGSLDNSIESQIGPCPDVGRWDPLSRKTIDREILKNMRPLWHSVSEEDLVQRLLNKEPNQEKYFYAALQRHRDEELENLVKTPSGVMYSSSDYHHSRPPKVHNSSPQLHKRRASQFSILNDEHLYSKHSFYEPPSSEGSYDPFHASRDPLVAGVSPGTTVTIRRGSSVAGSTLRSNTGNVSSSLRIQALRRARNKSAGALSQFSLSSSAGRKSVRSTVRATSQLSSSSSVFPSSPPVVIRARQTYKRGVSFAHLRRSSLASMPEAPELAVENRDMTPIQKKNATTEVESTFSKSNGVEMLNSRRDTAALPNKSPMRNPTTPSGGHLRIHKPHAPPSYYIEREARKVSTELDKLCDEAFFRASIGSTIITSASEKRSAYETSPSSISNSSPGCFSNCVRTPSPPAGEAAFRNRPLPPTPVETPNTYIIREIAETRARLAKRHLAEGDKTADFNEVLAHLDQLLKRPMTGKRAASAPQPKQQELSNKLPSIFEEAQYADAYGRYKESIGFRSVTDPLRPSTSPSRLLSRKPGARALRHVDQSGNTIRIVDPSSPIAPLNIRKRSGVSTLAASSHTSSPARPLHDPSGFLTPPRENGMLNTALASTSSSEKSIKKKRSWLFSRKGKESKIDEDERSRVFPAGWRELDDRMNKAAPISKKDVDAPKHSKHVSDPPSNSTESSEFPMRPAALKAPRSGFLRLFSRFVTKPDASKLEFDSGANLSVSSINSSLNFSTERNENTRPSNDYQSNWLARFLHIKPASKILCFQIGRGRARQEIVRLLRDWKRFGIREVAYDRVRNTISARISKNNHLNIKPVSLVIDLFVVLEHGRRAQLCLARFTQTKGAASSFKKVVDIIEDVCHGRGLLVEEEEKKAEMRDILEYTK